MKPDSDAIFGNKGDDILYGGDNGDGFYFLDNDGDDVIWDFDIAAGDKFVFISPNFDAYRRSELLGGRRERGDHLWFGEHHGRWVSARQTSTTIASLYLWY